MKHNHYLQAFTIITMEHNHMRGGKPHGHNRWKYGDGRDAKPLEPCFSRNAICLVVYGSDLQKEIS